MGSASSENAIALNTSLNKRPTLVLSFLSLLDSNLEIVLAAI